MDFTINTAALRACANTMAVKDIRYYLNGVSLRIKAGARTGMVCATNGHILFACQTPVTFFAPDGNLMGEHDTATPAIDLIIPDVIVKAIIKSKAATLTFKCMGGVSDTAPQGQYQIQDGATNPTFTPIDGKFPDYARVIPEKLADNDTAQFNPEYVLSLQKAFAALRDRKLKNYIPALLHSHGTGIVTDGYNDAIGVIMPVRNESCDGYNANNTFKFNRDFL